MDATPLLRHIGYPRIIAALGPKAHELAAERTDGVHPFLQPVAHTAVARAAVGPDKLVIPQQAVALETDPDTARGRLRAIYNLAQRNVENHYCRNYRRLGFTNEDLADDRSDRFIDAVLAWGDEDAIATRLGAHLDAGADHVLVHVLADSLTAAVDGLERLAPALLERSVPLIQR